MREQCVHASLSLRRIEDQLSLTIFLQYRVVVIDGHGTISVSVRRRSDPEHGEVDSIYQSGHTEQAQSGAHEQSSQPISEVWRGGLRHEARL